VHHIFALTQSPNQSCSKVADMYIYMPATLGVYEAGKFGLMASRVVS
jgi:hypothetical protein